MSDRHVQGSGTDRCLPHSDQPNDGSVLIPGQTDRRTRRLSRLAGMSLLLACLVVLLGMIWQLEEEVASGVVKPLNQWSGHYAGRVDKGPFIIRNQAEWRFFWESVVGNYYPAPKVPAVDFDKDMVVAWLGGRETGHIRTVTDFQMKKDEEGRLVISLSVVTFTESSVEVNHPFRIAVVPSHDQVEWRCVN